MAEEYEEPVSITCKVALANPCAVPKIIYMLCHAWYKLEKVRDSVSMHQLFVKGLREAKIRWEELCG